MIKIIYCEIMRWPVGYETNGMVKYFKYKNGKRVGLEVFRLAPSSQLNTSNPSSTGEQNEN